jgi:hypothetical protein
MIILTGNDLTLILPSAKLGNEITLPLRVKAKRAMSGERYTYITTPVKAKHVLQFGTLNNNQVEEVYDFIQANIGNYIQYIEDNIEESTISPTRKTYTHTARILDGAVDFVHRSIRNNEFNLTLEVGDYA